MYILLNPLQSGEWFYKDIKLENQPFYIGIGVGSRATVHSTKSSLERDYNEGKNKIIKEILSRGKKVIIHKVYEGLSISEAKEREIILIKHFGRAKYISEGILSNLSPGGDTTSANLLGSENMHSKKVYQYSLDGSFIKEWDCLRCITRDDGIPLNYNTIGDSCRSNALNNGTTYSAGDSMWFYDYKGENIKPYTYNNGQAKNVYRYCLRTLELLDTYLSAVDAGKDINSTKNAVSKSCVKHVKLKDCIYSYTELTLEDLESIRSKYRYFKNLDDGCVYLSLKELSKALGIKKETLEYWKTYNKMPKNIYINN